MTEYLRERVIRNGQFGTFGVADTWLIHFACCGDCSMGKGGSRFEAGWLSCRDKAKQLARVDPRDWHRLGRRWAGAMFTWSWNRGGDRSGSIGMQVFGSTSLLLQYTITDHDGRKRDASKPVCIADTPCHYGKERRGFSRPMRCDNPVDGID